MIQKWICRMARWPFSNGGIAPSQSRAVRVSDEARAVVHRESLAVFHTGRGLMFKANGAGAQIWEGLASRTPVDVLSGQLADRYAIPREQAERDVGQFISQLRSAGLVTRQEA